MTGKAERRAEKLAQITMGAAPEFAGGFVVVARFDSGRRMGAWRLTPEAALEAARQMESAAARMLAAQKGAE